MLDTRVRLVMIIDSAADMDLQRARAVAKVFDAHPTLRPRKAGGDPPRITLEPSMEAVVADAGLPIDWLTYREMKPELELGQIKLLPGRGGWTGDKFGGTWRWFLTGNSIEQRWGPSVANDPDLVQEVAELFQDLVVALDATWGAVDLAAAGLSAGPAPWHRLAGAFWVNYFGPAFSARFPELNSIAGARALSGGVLIRVGESPRTTDEILVAKAGLCNIFEPQAFEYHNPNPALPSVEDHLAASPGTDVMPWVVWEERRVEQSTAQRHVNARKRLAAAVESRSVPILADDAQEWSASLDLPDWKAFAAFLKRKLRGEFSGPIGTALLAVVSTAPLEQENSVELNTNLGVVRLGWFIDDVETVDVYVWGSEELSRICTDWFEHR